VEDVPESAVEEILYERRLPIPVGRDIRARTVVRRSCSEHHHEPRLIAGVRQGTRRLLEAREADADARELEPLLKGGMAARRITT
jgi:hypothetical protein